MILPPGPRRRRSADISELVRRALIRDLGWGAVARIQEKFDLDEEPAMKMAYDELSAYRKERDSAEEGTSNSVDHVSEDDLVARIAADRRAGRDTTKDVETLLRVAGEKNRAALDRLAQ